MLSFANVTIHELLESSYGLEAEQKGLYYELHFMYLERCGELIITDNYHSRLGFKSPKRMWKILRSLEKLEIISIDNEQRIFLPYSDQALFKIIQKSKAAKEEAKQILKKTKNINPKSLLYNVFNDDKDNENENTNVNKIKDGEDPIYTPEEEDYITSAYDKWYGLTEAYLRIKEAKLTNDRKNMICHLLYKYGMDKWEKAISNIEFSDYLLGNTHQKKPVKFDWFIQEMNFLKVLDGTYDST